MEILKAKNLRVSSFSPDGEKKIIRDLSFSLEKGGSLAIIGGVGAGKTVTARALFGSLPEGLKVAGGRIFFREGEGAMKSSANGEFMRAHAAFVGKDPSAQFSDDRAVKRQLEDIFLMNPKPDIREMRLKYAFKILCDEYGCDGEEIRDSMHRAIDGINFTSAKKTAPAISSALGKGGLDARYCDVAAEKIASYCCRREEKFAEERVRDIALFVGISDPDVLKFRPSRLTMDALKLASVAQALLYKPEIIIFDEPLSYVGAVDKGAVESAIKKAGGLGIALLIFTREIRLAGRLADEVCVIYRGAICEKGRTEEVFSSPSHEYTRALLSEGDVLSLSPNGDSFGAHVKKAGCAYAYNCAAVKQICRDKAPVEIKYGKTHSVFCWSAYEECYKAGRITLKGDEITQSVVELSPSDT